jgi:hypothetical protein
MVDGFYHAAPGAEVLLEEHPAGLALLGLLAAVPLQLVKKYAGLRQAKAYMLCFTSPTINRLRPSREIARCRRSWISLTSWYSSARMSV